MSADPAVTDPFGTAALRTAVLDAWSRTPTRLREDANTEEDHATGYYRDRVVVELAQNAADAASRAGAPGTLLLRLVEDDDGATLVAANTGEPLDARGVVSLSSMRASAKTGGAASAVGRFGVGFAAVRGVSDDLVVRTSQGGVRFSVALTRETLDRAAESAGPRAAELADLVAARGDSLPALRLPFPAASLTAVPSATDPEDGLAAEPRGAVPASDDLLDGAGAPFATVVELRLRDAAAVAEVRRQLDDVDDALLLALPALATVEIQHRGRARRTPSPADQTPPTGAAVVVAPDDRVLTDVGSRWVTAEGSGTVPAALVADRPVEERGRSTWTITWAVRRGRPTGSRPEGRGVVHAPTPTDEPLTVPALLVAAFPLDPSRRHVAEGPLTSFVAEQAGPVLAVLAAQLDDPLALVPTGLPAGRLDTLVRDSVTAALEDATLFDGRRARDVAALGTGASPALLSALAPTGLGVVDVAPGRLAAARALGMPVLTVPEVVDALPSALTPRQWRALYAALAPSADADRAVRESLDGILVPLADGTTARGPRGLVLPPGETVVDGLLTVPGLRLVHPEASDPLLRRLGAVDLDDPTVLGLAAVEAAVEEVAELLLDRRTVDTRPGTVLADAGLGPLPGLLALLTGVVEAHGDAAVVPPWWGDLPLPDSEGTWTRACDLVWPGSWASEHLDLAELDLSSLQWSLADPTALADQPVFAEQPVLAERTALACGVRATLTVRTADLDTGDADDGLETGTGGRSPDDAPDVPGWADYDAYLCAVLGRGAHLDELTVLLDLDAVHDDSWGEVARLAERDPDVRRALVSTVGPVSAGGPAALSYAAWYVRDVVDAPFVVRGDGGDLDPGLLAVLPPVPDDLAEVHDPQVLAALGGVSTVAQLTELLARPDPSTWDGFFTALDSPDRPEGTAVPRAVARAVWDGLGRAALAGLELDDLPDTIIAVRAGTCRTVDAASVVVAVEPMWAQVRSVVPAAGRETGEAVADLLDVPVADASSVVVQTPDDPAEHEVPTQVVALLPGLPLGWHEHADLVVDGQDVDWWVTADGGVHVRSGASRAALAQGLAQAGDRWADRYLLEMLLADPSRAADVDLHRAWEL